MSAPDREAFAALLAFGGHPLDPARLDAVAAAQSAMWPSLQALRDTPLAFVDALEPGHALARLHGGTR